MEEKHHIYGLDKHTGKPRHISEVSSGNACNCICADPRCNQPLCAKKGVELRHHFSHQRSTGCTAGRFGGGARESIFHYCLKEAIYKASCLPIATSTLSSEVWELLGYQEAVKDTGLHFTSAKMEKRLVTQFSGHRQPDVSGVLNGQKLAIEVTYTHATSDTKVAEMESVGFETIEVKVNLARLPNISELTALRQSKDWHGLLRIFTPSMTIQWPRRWTKIEDLLSLQVKFKETKNELHELTHSYDKKRYALGKALGERDEALKKVSELEEEKEQFLEEALQFVREKENEIEKLKKQSQEHQSAFVRASREVRFLKSYLNETDENFDFESLYRRKEKEQERLDYIQEFYGE